MPNEQFIYNNQMPEQMLVKAEVYDDKPQLQKIKTKSKHRKTSIDIEQDIDKSLSCLQQYRNNSLQNANLPLAREKLESENCSLSTSNLREVKRSRWQSSGTTPIVRVESLIELSALNTPLFGVSPANERRKTINNNKKSDRPLLIKSNKLSSTSSIVTFSSV